jgi:hypothetical protein
MKYFLPKNDTLVVDWVLEVTYSLHCGPADFPSAGEIVCRYCFRNRPISGFCGWT